MILFPLYRIMGRERANIILCFMYKIIFYIVKFSWTVLSSIIFTSFVLFLLHLFYFYYKPPFYCLWLLIRIAAAVIGLRTHHASICLSTCTAADKPKSYLAGLETKVYLHYTHMHQPFPIPILHTISFWYQQADFFIGEVRHEFYCGWSMYQTLNLIPEERRRRRRATIFFYSYLNTLI